MEEKNSRYEKVLYLIILKSCLRGKAIRKGLKTSFYKCSTKFVGTKGDDSGITYDIIRLNG